MPVRNLLLAAIPRDVLDQLAKHFRIVELKKSEVLHLPGQKIETIYFPIDCLISVTVTMAGARTVEAGIVGSREMVGLNAFMGGRETNQTEYICQFPGKAVRIGADLFLEHFDHNKAVRDVMLRFTQAYIAQISQNVACNRLHTLVERMARWILECRDRLKTDDLNMTHEFIGQMLGVRRAGVTEGAAELQQQGLIDYERGRVSVINGAGLETASCECFGVIRDEYNRLLNLELHG
jgi:CRP-like cAMP-binding protein